MEIRMDPRVHFKTPLCWCCRIFQICRGKMELVQFTVCLYDDFADAGAATALSPSKKTSSNRCVPPKEIEIFMDLLDCNPEEGEAGAPAHLGGRRRSRRRWGRAASRGGALTLVSCAKRGIPTTATCTLTPRNAEVHTARGRNTLGPSLGVKMREQNKKTFSAGSPRPSLRRLITRKTHAPWGVRGVCRCHLATRSQPIPCLLLSSAAWWPHRDTAWSVRPVSLYIEGKKTSKQTKTERCPGLTDPFCGKSCSEARKLDPGSASRSSSKGRTSPRLARRRQRREGRHEERGCFQSSTQQGGSLPGWDRGVFAWAGAGPSRTLGLFNGTSSIPRWLKKKNNNKKTRKFFNDLF